MQCFQIHYEIQYLSLLMVEFKALKQAFIRWTVKSQSYEIQLALMQKFTSGTDSFHTNIVGICPLNCTKSNYVHSGSVNCIINLF